MKFLRRLFGKDDPPPPQSRPPINEDWRVGDLAVCIRNDWVLVRGADTPTQGKVYRVADVYPSYGALMSGKPSWGLGLDGLFSGVRVRGYDANGFRKAEPDNKKASLTIREMIDQKAPA